MSTILQWLIHSEPLHKTLRHWGYVLGAVVVGMYALSRIFPAPAPVTHGPVVVVSPAPSEREIHAVEQSVNKITKTLDGVVSVLDKPGATVVHQVTGLPLAQSASVLQATKPVTVQKIEVDAHLVAPSPAPTPSDAFMQNIYNAAYSADTHALNDTKIAANVNISQEEAKRSLFGSAFTTDGAGLSFAAWRRKQLELNIAAIVKSSHMIPGACFQYMVPHTALAGGPCVTYDHGFRIGIGATENF